MPQTLLLDIAQAGILAPSADNDHVFHIEFTESAICLWPTAEFAAATEGLRRVLGLISLGAVVENMQLRAGELGLLTKIHWFLSEKTGPIARLDFEYAKTAAFDDLATAIPARHTNRRMYSGPGLTEDETNALNTAVEPVQGTQLIWLQGDVRRRALRLIWRAESERFLRRDLHQDLFKSIRFDLPWNETADRALPPGSLEIEKPMRPLFRALRKWALMRPLTWVGVHWLIGLRAGWLPAWQAPALGVLVTSLPCEQGSVAVGTALERLWLRTTTLGLAMQPMAASAVLIQPPEAEHGASVGLRTALTNEWEKIAPGKTPMMVFRAGRVGPPTVRADRKPIKDYIHFTPQH